MKPTVGRIVHFVMMDATHAPALVTKAWDDETVNLQVFPDMRDPEVQSSSKLNEETKFPGTWHWPEKVDE